MIPFPKGNLPAEILDLPVGALIHIPAHHPDPELYLVKITKTLWFRAGDVECLENHEIQRQYDYPYNPYSEGWDLEQPFFQGRPMKRIA
jgi:hypothetical protein